MWKNLAARLGWTMLAAGGANMTAAAVLDVQAWKMAAATALAAGINVLTLYARKRAGTFDA